MCNRGAKSDLKHAQPEEKPLYEPEAFYGGWWWRAAAVYYWLDISHKRRYKACSKYANLTLSGKNDVLKVKRSLIMRADVLLNQQF